MTNLKLLKEEIERSGMTDTAIAKRSGMKRATYYNRLAGKGEYKASEIHGITKALRLTNAKRDAIFFAD